MFRPVGGGRAERGDVQLALPEQLGEHREAEAVAAGHLLVGRVQPGLGFGDQVALARTWRRRTRRRRTSLHVIGGQVGRGATVGQRGAVVLEREAVVGGPEPGVGTRCRSALSATSYYTPPPPTTPAPPRQRRPPARPLPVPSSPQCQCPEGSASSLAATTTASDVGTIELFYARKLSQLPSPVDGGRDLASNTGSCA